MEHISNNQDHFYIQKLLPYEDFLAWQKELVMSVREHREESHFILCSHPETYTLGRGLQKNTGKDLKHFDSQNQTLPYPLHQINRGGGLTFHHPGQFIFYAIVNLNKKDWNLKFHYEFLMKNVAKVLNTYGLQVECSTKLAGLWLEDRKLASIGVGIEHFVTTHGLALNLSFTKVSTEALALTHPCGLNSDIYSSLKKETNTDINFLKFSKIFKERIILRNNYLQF